MDDKPPSAWQVIFTASKVNGGVYYGGHLTLQPWNWPKETYLQRRLHELREQQKTETGE